MTHSVFVVVATASVWGGKEGEDGVLNLSSSWVFPPDFEIAAPRMMAGNDAGLVGGGVPTGESEV